MYRDDDRTRRTQEGHHRSVDREGEVKRSLRGEERMLKNGERKL